MAKSTRANVTNLDGSLTVQQHETDSPIIHIEQIERLHKFRPDLVDWIFDQTKAEAEHRRKQETKINDFIHKERLIGQLSALLIGLSGIIGGIFVILQGYPGYGVSISTVCLAGLGVAFLTGNEKKSHK